MVEPTLKNSSQRLTELVGEAADRIATSDADQAVDIATELVGEVEAELQSGRRELDSATATYMRHGGLAQLNPGLALPLERELLEPTQRETRTTARQLAEAQGLLNGALLRKAKGVSGATLPVVNASVSLEDLMPGPLRDLAARLVEEGKLSFPLTRQFSSGNGYPLFALGRLYRAAVEIGCEDSWVFSATGLPHWIVAGGGKHHYAVEIGAQARRDISLTFEDQRPLANQEKVLGARISEASARELRALRKASEVFESATPLRHDVGGWAGNALANAGLSDQQRCSDEAETYALFVKNLMAQGLMPSFEPMGVITRDNPTGALLTALGLGHAACAFRHRSSGEIFVIDGWYEGGGKAAHILRLDDWMAGQHSTDVVSLLP